MPSVTSKEHQTAAMLIRRLLAVLRENEDLISIGAYREGTNPMVDLALTMREPINQLLRQAMDEQTTTENTMNTLMELARRCAG